MHSYSSIHLHVVFATWNRQRFIIPVIRPRLHAYIAATARRLGVRDVEAGGHDDHVHLLGRFDPAKSHSSVIGQIKQAATHWMREQDLFRFRWQRGFGAFSVSPDRVAAVARYIKRQEEHHRRATFHDELERLLAELGVNIKDVRLL